MFTNNLIAGASGQQGFYDFPIEQSLKFNDDDSSYLSWTPASAGNRKTWTWSGWVKRGNIGTDQLILHCYDGSSSNRGVIKFSSGNVLEFDTGGSGSVGRIDSSAVFRDTSAWYHIVAVMDTSNATATDRQRLYVNGERISVTVDAQVAQNFDGLINTTNSHQIGSQSGVNFFDGYMAEVNFIDGQALDPTSFGEFKSGVWIPKNPSGLTYGTNGFRLSFQNDTVSEGFNTVTFSSDGSAGSVSGLGFSPDFVWAKSRTNADGHELWDTVRGTSSTLFSNVTEAQDTSTGRIVSFDADGFSYGTNGNMQTAGNFVAWCWDAGSGSPASNTSGSITSTVKANTAYGFSIVSYTGNSTNGATVGHGLNQKPQMIIVKNRNDGTKNWAVYHEGIGASKWLKLNLTDAAATDPIWASTEPTSSVFYLNSTLTANDNGDNFIAYAFHSVTNYSKVGSYSGSGSSGNTITTGFKTAFVMIKRTDSAANWIIFDNTRDTAELSDAFLYPNLSDAEGTSATKGVEFTDTGFILQNDYGDANASGATYAYIAFADTRDNAFWRDQSGNGNDWQPNNLTYQDSLPDSTSNNFAVLNPLKSDGATLSEGNAKVVVGTSGGRNSTSTFAVSSGKWYAESICTANTINSNGFGVTNVNRPNSTLPYTYSDGVIYEASTGQKYIDGTNTSYGATFTTGDVIGIALDLDNDEITFYKNGSSQGTITTKTFSGTYEFVLPNFTGSYTVTYVANFGQDSSFAGNKPAQGNTDDNGVGDFFYSPPSGFLALAASNLPNLTIDPAQDDVPSDYFNTVLYTGNGVSSASGGHAITGVGYQPDMVWTKQRSSTTWHMIHDAVRGAGANKSLSTNSANGEPSNGEAHLMSFDTDGFTVGHEDSGSTNVSGGSYVAWNWLASNSTSNNTSGSITSTVSVNQKAGFSIVKWAGNSTNATIGHGLGAAPSWVLVKRYDRNGDAWRSYHAPLGPTKFLEIFNTDAAQTSAVGAWNDTAPTSSVFTIGSGLNNGGDIIAYCFAEVEGYSKFGSYTGNGSTDGPMVWTGHAPAFLMVKRTDAAGSWVMLDTQRSTYNVVDDTLWANLSSAEATYTWMDFLSNGFKLRDASNGLNNSGASYIFMSFASNPFKYSTAR